MHIAIASSAREIVLRIATSYMIDCIFILHIVNCTLIITTSCNLLSTTDFYCSYKHIC